jgi:hypothetical protein
VKPQVRTIVAVSLNTVRRAEARISACQKCDPTVDSRFDSVLADLVPVPGAVEVVMCEPARCPGCNAEIFEHTLVESPWPRNSGASHT